MLILLVALLGGLIPTLFYLLCFWWLDRYEKEPVWLLVLAFLWGAFPAAILSVVFEFLLTIPIAALGEGTVEANLVSVSLGAPLVEESFKGAALLILVLVLRREFDDVLDGIVYGATIGLGFALTENVLAYFLPILRQQGIGAGLTNIFMRSIVFGVNHAFWTGVTGAALGYARLAQRRAQRLWVPVAGWALAVALHAVHNAGAVLAEQTTCLSLGISMAVDWGGLLLLLAVAGLTLGKESGWIARGLEEEVRRGSLSLAEFELLRSAPKRLMVRWRSWGRGGRRAYRVVGRYYQCATELSFRKHHLRSFGDESGNVAEVGRLRHQLAAVRAEALPWL